MLIYVDSRWFKDLHIYILFIKHIPHTSPTNDITKTSQCITQIPWNNTICQPWITRIISYWLEILRENYGQAYSNEFGLFYRYPPLFPSLFFYFYCSRFKVQTHFSVFAFELIPVYVCIHANYPFVSLVGTLSLLKFEGDFTTFDFWNKIKNKRGAHADIFKCHPYETTHIPGYLNLFNLTHYRFENTIETHFLALAYGHKANQRK